MARRAHQYLPKRPRRREAVRWHVGECDKVTVHDVPCKRRLGDSGVIVRDAGRSGADPTGKPAKLAFRGRTLLGSRRLEGRRAQSGTCDFNGLQMS
jgi:hypothetical protein